MPGTLLPDNAALPHISRDVEPDLCLGCNSKGLELTGTSMWHYRVQLLCPDCHPLISATTYTFLSSHSSYKTSRASRSTLKWQDYWPLRGSTVWASTTTQNPASFNCSDPNLMSWKC